MEQRAVQAEDAEEAADAAEEEEGPDRADAKGVWDAGVEHVEQAEEDGDAHAREEDL